MILKSGVPYQEVGAEKAVYPTSKWELKNGVGSQDPALFYFGGLYEFFILYGRYSLL